LEFAINELESKSRISDDDFSAAASALRDQEQQCDQRLTEELLKTLTPEQAEKLAVCAIGFNTLDFAQMHFVSRVMKLRREQQELFDKASETVRSCLRVRLMKKHPAGGDLTDEISVTKAIEESSNSLDPVQLDIYFRGTGYLNGRQSGESLKAYFQRQAPEEQKKLTKLYGGFRAIKEEIDKEAQLDRPNH
jgi:hypothetical protein